MAKMSIRILRLQPAARPSLEVLGGYCEALKLGSTLWDYTLPTIPKR